MAEQIVLPTHHRFQDLTGREFGKLTVVRYFGRNHAGFNLWLCRCTCDTETKVTSGNLRSGTRSCGQIQCKENITKHGLRFTSEYAIWHLMKHRCFHPADKYYTDYGGRGITVCDRWKDSVENFYADMGPRPSPKHTIDRIDVNGNYEPGNCRWATAIEQGNNRRNNHPMTLGDRTLTATEWSRELGVSIRTILSRLRLGWSDERALSTPVDPNRRRKPAC